MSDPSAAIGGYAAVQARIASIEEQFQGAPASSTSAADFADLLSSATGDSSWGSPSGSSSGLSSSGLSSSGLSSSGLYASGLDGLSGPASGPSSVTGGEVVADAEQYLGVPYKWGGTDPSTGLDCSGLVQRVYADLGISLPRVASDQAQQGTAVPNLANAQPGDLVTFGSPAEHIGIYVGNGMMIDAPHTGAQVRMEPVGDPTSIRRIIGSTDTTGGAGGQYAGLFDAASAQYGVPANLLAAVAQVESGDDPTAVSGAGAEGLMQLMPSTASGLGVNPFDPSQAVDGGAQLLSQDLQEFGSVPLALAAYNAGAGAVKAAGGIPDYPETQAYVQKVLAAAGGMPS